MRGKARGCTCTVPECGREVVAKGLCVRHYLRKRKHGDVSMNKKPNNGTRRYISDGYVMILQDDGTYRGEHVLMAEAALGGPLPKGAHVHHMDRDPANNNTKSAWNLVVCPDSAYHRLLHRRARMLGYDPPQANSKLTYQQAEEIRRSTAPQKTLAIQYGVSVSSIQKVRAGTNHKPFPKN